MEPFLFNLLVVFHVWLLRKKNMGGGGFNFPRNYPCKARLLYAQVGNTTAFRGMYSKTSNKRSQKRAICFTTLPQNEFKSDVVCTFYHTNQMSCNKFDCSSYEKLLRSREFFIQCPANAFWCKFIMSTSSFQGTSLVSVGLTHLALFWEEFLPCFHKH